MMNQIAKEAYEIAKRRGKYKNKNLAKCLLDIRSEVKEAMEAKTSREQVEELIDVLACTLSTLYFVNADIDKLLQNNFEYNKQREDYMSLKDEYIKKQEKK